MGEYISIFKDTLVNKYCQFAGVASRKEFWTFFVIVMIIGWIASFISPTVAQIINLLLLLPNLGVSARRLRDAGYSPWWLLIALTGIGVIVLLFFWAQKSKN